MKKLRLGVIGTGLAWDRLHYPALKELSDKYEIVAVCNKAVDKAQGFAQGINLSQENIYGDYNEMLKRDDIDVVDVLVPISENFEVARDVLNAGKNLIAEKPFAATIEGAKELIELKNKNNLKVMVAENFRYEDGNRMIKDIISKGKIGEVAYFVFNTAANFQKEQYTDSFASTEWRQHPYFEGGIFLDGGVHDMALMRFLFGEVEEVNAYARPQDEDFCKYMNINCIIKFQNSVIGSYNFYSSGGDLQKPPIGLRIFGTLGEIHLESKDCGVIDVHYKDGKCEKINYMPSRGYYNELLNFYDGNIICTPEKEVGDIELIFKILGKLK
jgi:predicted dehydrogenase